MDHASDRSDQARIDFLDNEIDLCQTFLDLASIDKDDPPVAEEAKANARKGYETALSWVKAVRDPQEQTRLAAKLYRLKERLDSARADSAAS